VFIDWFLPGYKAGGPIRSCANLLDHLWDRFDFYVVTRNTDYFDPTPYPNIPVGEWIQVDGKYHVLYLSENQIEAARFSELLDGNAWDAVYLNSFFSPAFAILPLRLLKKRPHLKVVLAPRGMLAPGALAVKKWKKKAYMWYAHILGFYDRLIFQATSDEESAHIRHFFPENEIRFAPSLPRKVQTGLTIAPRTGALNILTVSRIAKEKNVLGAAKALASVKEEVHWTLAGPVYDASYWEECMKVIKTFPRNVGFTYHGPADAEQLAHLLSEHELYFQPTFGENFGHAILEALSHAIPVLVSDKTPWRNLEAQKAGLDLALEPLTLMSQAIERFAGMSPEEFQQWREGALALGMSKVNDSGALDANYRLFL
jgi:glycosyltransferase involved in cell wall biosynthesis